MGPNLRRLFDTAGIEPSTPDELDRAQAATMALFDMFDTHGEALIAALDDFNTYYGMKGWDKRELELTDRISKLLAQLESEAQP